MSAWINDNIATLCECIEEKSLGAEMIQGFFRQKPAATDADIFASLAETAIAGKIVHPIDEFSNEQEVLRTSRQTALELVRECVRARPLSELGVKPEAIADLLDRAAAKFIEDGDRPLAIKAIQVVDGMMSLDNSVACRSVKGSLGRIEKEPSCIEIRYEVQQAKMKLGAINPSLQEETVPKQFDAAAKRVSNVITPSVHTLYPNSDCEVVGPGEDFINRPKKTHVDVSKIDMTGSDAVFLDKNGDPIVAKHPASTLSSARPLTKGC